MFKINVTLKQKYLCKIHKVFQSIFIGKKLQLQYF